MAWFKKNTKFLENESRNNKFFFTFFSKKQIEFSIKLNKFLMRGFNINKFNALGYSDISVPYLRKKDPAPLFPHKKFAENGIGVWPTKEEIEEYKKTFCFDVLKFSNREKIDWFVKK